MIASRSNASHSMFLDPALGKIPATGRAVIDRSVVLDRAAASWYGPDLGLRAAVSGTPGARWKLTEVLKWIFEGLLDGAPDDSLSDFDRHQRHGVEVEGWSLLAKGTTGDDFSQPEARSGTFEELSAWALVNGMSSSSVNCRTK